MKPNKAHILTLASLFLTACAQVAAVAQDLKPEEVVEKHIAATGGSSKLAEIKNRVVAGQSSFESKLPSRKAGGKALIVSDNANLMFISSFASTEYPMEKIGYFKDRVSLPWVTAGTRSPLGAFLADHEKVLSDGLFGGAMSSSWALLRPNQSGFSLKYAGSKKVDGRRVQVLEYLSKGIGSQEFTIRLFFDAETFLHVRTEYKREISSSQDTFGQLGRQAGVKISLTETFGDFRKVDGYTFPYDYKAEYRTDSNGGTYEYVWGVKVGAYNLNQTLAADFFTFEGK